MYWTVPAWSLNWKVAAGEELGCLCQPSPLASNFLLGLYKPVLSTDLNRHSRGLDCLVCLPLLFVNLSPFPREF